MERSSPLAAMQPPSLSFGQWGCGSSIPTSYCNYEKFSNVGLDFGSSRFNFNLKDLSMTKPSTDYFSLKPVRGSSPTSSLAADLSQNFHIDRTFVNFYRSVFIIVPNLLQAPASNTSTIAVLPKFVRHDQRTRYASQHIKNSKA